MAGNFRLAGRRVLVIGGSGFVGRHVCAALAGAGAEVAAVARTPGVSGPDGPVWRFLDLVSAGPRAIAEMIRPLRPDVVVNCAGAVWQPTASQLRTGNVELVRALAGALGDLRRRPLLVQLGSVHEYGSGTGTGTLAEGDPAEPVTDYGRSKLLGTEAVLAAVREFGLNGVVLRVANTAGPGLPRGSLLGGVAGRLADLRREPPPGGAPVDLDLPPLRVHRDFLDIRDLADAVVTIAGTPAKSVSGEVFNIGSGRAVPVWRIVDRLIALSGLPVRQVPRPAPDRQDVAVLRLDITKARTRLGWRPRRGLDASLSDMLATA